MSAPVPASTAAREKVPAATPAPTSSRLVSLDALRGFDMFWILGGDALLHVLARTWPVQPFTGLARQVDHADWAGFRFYDLIFPLFVFMAGASLVFSLTRIIAERGRGAAVKRVLVRAAILFLIALFYSGGFTNEWPNMRLLGVINRIALAYAGAGLLFCFLRPRGLAVATVVLLAGYWALMTFVPVRDIALDKDAMIARFGPKPTLEQVQQAYDATTTRVTGRYEPGLNVSNHFDFEHLPGRKYDVYWDPEGILSTIPAVATCLLGVFAGLLIRRSDVADRKKVAWLAAAGVAGLALGFLWGLQFPVVKKIWTSSFVLVAGGWSALLLAAFYYTVDIRGWRGWCQPFVWIGMNPITLYVIHGNLVGFPRTAQRFAGGSVKAFFERNVTTGAGDVVLALVSVGLVFLLARFLYQRKIFLRV
jgi:predicted acyltransferase